MVLTLGRNFPCYWVIIWFYKANTASSTRCYCSISRINNRRFSPDNNQSAWTMHSLKSTHSHSTLSHTDTYRLGVSLCYSATSSITDKNVRHLEWVRNSCYCIEVLPRDTHPLEVLLYRYRIRSGPSLCLYMSSPPLVSGASFINIT